MSKIKDIWQKVDNQFVRFVLVGILNTAFGYGVYCLMLWIGLSYWWATLIANVLGVLFNFKTTGVLVFKSVGVFPECRHHRAIYAFYND